MPTRNILEIGAGGALIGTVIIPGDKSVSHRAVMFGALADGPCTIRDCLMGEDVVSTINAFRAMGVTINDHGSGCLTIHGVGVDGLHEPSGALDLGNSGTSMRLLCGILAGARVHATLTGDASLCRRPMLRVATPLNAMGARIETAAGGTPPLQVIPGQRLQAIDYALPVASAQVKSALLLAGLYAAGTTRVTEPAPTRDHTERMLGAFGVAVAHGDGCAAIAGGQRLRPTDIVVPADISSAAFFIVGASIAPGSHLVLPSVGINATRTGILEIMTAMGARITTGAARACGDEPVADLDVTAAPLIGIEIPPHTVPLAIDEFPSIFVAAACARGRTVLRGASELRHKESDRIAVMATGLRTLGIAVETFDDGIAIEGGALQGGRVDAHGDHRIAMAFAMAALRANGPVVIDNAAAIATSFPEFVARARATGLRISS